MTQQKAIEIYLTLPPEKRELARKDAAFLAGIADGMGHPDLATREVNRALLAEMEQAEKALLKAQNPMPEAVTWKEAAAVVSWVLKPICILVVAGSGLYLIGSFVSGLSVGFRVLASANAALFLLPILALFGLWFVSELPKVKSEEEAESEPGGGNVQQIIVNINAANGSANVEQR